MSSCLCSEWLFWSFLSKMSKINIMLIMLTVITSDSSNQSNHFKTLITQWLFNYYCYIISYERVLILDSLLRFSSWKSLFLHVFSLHNQNFILHRRDFLECINSERAVMHLCEHCSCLQKKCHVDNEINYCIECMHLDCKCNLTFSMMKWKKIKTECNHVLDELLNAHKQMQKIFAKTTHLQNQFVFLKNKKQIMIE